jgi:hypothetical protein
MNRSIYLDTATDIKFKAKCEQLGIKEGEITQKMIQMFVNTPKNSNPKECLECQYYQLGQTEVFETMKRVNKLTDIFLGNLVQRK